MNMIFFKSPNVANIKTSIIIDMFFFS